MLPHPEVTRLHAEAEFKYDKSQEDRGYENWYTEVKKGKVTKLITQMFRTRRLVDNQKQDFIFYDATFTGTDRRGNPLSFSTRLGRYEKPSFRKIVDERTDKIVSNEIYNKEMTYDIPFTLEKFDELLDEAVEDGLSLVVITPGKNYTIADIEDFRNASYDELLEMARTGKSLSTVRNPAPVPEANKKKA